jgi:hypothetical protein
LAEADDTTHIERVRATGRVYVAVSEDARDGVITADLCEEGSCGPVKGVRSRVVIGSVIDMLDTDAAEVLVPLPRVVRGERLLDTAP